MCNATLVSPESVVAGSISVGFYIRGNGICDFVCSCFIFFYSRFVLYVCVCLYVSVCSCLHGRVSECRMFL